MVYLKVLKIQTRSCYICSNWNSIVSKLNLEYFLGTILKQLFSIFDFKWEFLLIESDLLSWQIHVWSNILKITCVKSILNCLLIFRCTWQTTCGCATAFWSGWGGITREMKARLPYSRTWNLLCVTDLTTYQGGCLSGCPPGSSLVTMTITTTTLMGITMTMIIKPWKLIFFYFHENVIHSMNELHEKCLLWKIMYLSWNCTCKLLSIEKVKYQWHFSKFWAVRMMTTFSCPAFATCFIANSVFLHVSNVVDTHFTNFINTKINYIPTLLKAVR